MSQFEEIPSPGRGFQGSRALGGLAACKTLASTIRFSGMLSAVGSPKTPSAAQTTHISQLSAVGSPNAIDAAPNYSQMHHA